MSMEIQLQIEPYPIATDPRANQRPSINLAMRERVCHGTKKNIVNEMYTCFSWIH